MLRLPTSRTLAGASLAAVAALSLGACASDLGPGQYERYEAGAPQRVDEGRVISSRPIALGGGDRGGATAIGALSGGAVGAQFGGRGVDHAAFGIAGAVLGALAGNAIAKNNEAQGYAYVIRFRDDSTVEIPQVDAYPIPDGTRVFVSYGDRVRIRPAGSGESLPPPRTYGREGYRDYPPPPPPPRY